MFELHSTKDDSYDVERRVRPLDHILPIVIEKFVSLY